MRLLPVLAAVSVAALAAATPSAGKEGARAQLTSALPLAAKPGTTIRVAWRVDIPDGRGGRRPFGAGDMFVRLLSRTGAPATIGFDDGSGRYETRLRVPEGGIGGVRTGLRGITCDGSRPGCHPSALAIPLANDPFRSPGGVRCDVAAVRSTLDVFVRAYNSGDLRRLDRLFSRERFVWYSWGGSARSDRAALVPNLRRRHERGDRLRAVTFRFNGYDRDRDRGHFQLSGRRRADDLQGGSWFELTGKGALDCAQPPVSLALLFLGRPR